MTENGRWKLLPWLSEWEASRKTENYKLQRWTSILTDRHTEYTYGTSSPIPSHSTWFHCDTINNTPVAVSSKSANTGKMQPGSNWQIQDGVLQGPPGQLAAYRITSRPAGGVSDYIWVVHVPSRGRRGQCFLCMRCTAGSGRMISAHHQLAGGGLGWADWGDWLAGVHNIAQNKRTSRI